MPSDGADFWRHRKCYGHVFKLVERGATPPELAESILNGLAFELRRFAPQLALRPAIKVGQEVLNTFIAQTGGLFSMVPAARDSLRKQLEGVRKQYGDCESTRLICEGVATACHTYITALQGNSCSSTDGFEAAALKAVFRHQVAHNIVETLRDHHIRYQEIEPAAFDGVRNKILDQMEATGLLLMESCLRSKSGIPSKNWRTGGKTSFKNDINSLNACIGIIQ